MGHGRLWREEPMLACSSITCFLKSNKHLHTSLGKRTSFSFLWLVIIMQQYNKYLKVDLLGSKATSKKQKFCFLFFLPQPGIKPGHFSPESSALLSESSHLFQHQNLFFKFTPSRFDGSIWKTTCSQENTYLMSLSCLEEFPDKSMLRMPRLVQGKRTCRTN